MEAAPFVSGHDPVISKVDRYLNLMSEEEQSNLFGDQIINFSS